MVKTIIEVTLLIIVLIGVGLFPVWLAHRRWKRDFRARCSALLERSKRWNKEFFSQWGTIPQERKEQDG